MGGILIFIVSILVAPAVGWFASVHGLEDIATRSGTTVEVALAYCSSPEGTEEVCGTVRLLHWLYRLSLGSLAASILLPLFYWICALILGRNRDNLARFFPPLVRVVLGLLPLLLVAHGLLVWLASWELLQAGILPGRWQILLAAFFLGFGLIFAAWSILIDLRRLLALEPLRVMGVELERSEYPELFERVSRLAAKLKSRAPQRIILGVEPTAFVTAAPLRLRGIGDLPAGETLYLSTVALRVLDDVELDALIGHELGHFRGEDVQFSSRFAPAFASLEQAVESVAIDDEEENGYLQVARLPAIGLLSLMIYILGSVVSRIGRERELAADQAALEVSSPRAVVTLLIKFGAINLRWPYFRKGLSDLLHNSTGRRNISRDYLAHTRDFIAACHSGDLRAALLEAHAPHPLDTHPRLAARAAAVGSAPDVLIGPTLAEMKVERALPAMLAKLEEKITAVDLDYSRVPGHPISIQETEALPPELAIPDATNTDSKTA